MGFPGGSAGKESACNAGDLGLIPGWEDPLEKGKATHPVFWPGEFHGLGHPQSPKELDTTERLSFTSQSVNTLGNIGHVVYLATTQLCYYNEEAPRQYAK